MTQPHSRAEWQRMAAELRYPTGHFIDGEHVSARDGRFTVVNPATGQPLCEVAAGTAVDIDAAVASGRRAFAAGSWRRMAPRDRLDVLTRLAALIEKNADRFALLDTLVMGKPIRDMVAIDVPQSALTFRYFAELSDKVEGSVTATAVDAFHYTLREPLGVVGCIVPWNYPLMMTSWKVAPALAAGNSVVLKPAEQSPLSALLLAELFVEAGGPAGVFNVVNGYGAAAGAPLALHGDVAKIAFTGSTVTGKKMLEYAGQSNMKRVSLECGGKSPQVFLADVADLDRAVTAAYRGIYANMGEVCNAGSRLLVDRSLVEKFVQRFVELGKDAFQPGDPLDPATTMGPLVTRGAQQRVLRMIEAGQREGAKLQFGGTAPAGMDAGAYVSPTLFTGVRNDMSIARQEIFGPVAAVIPFDGVEEAIAIANDTIYGLAAGVWTRDLNSAFRLVRGIEAGVIWINCFDEGDMTQPFGGFKQSGNTRDKCMDSFKSYTQAKSAWFRLS